MLSSERDNECPGDKGAGWFPVAVTIPGQATALRFVGITGDVRDEPANAYCRR